MKLRQKGVQLSHKLRETILDCTFSPYYIPSEIFLLLVLLKQLKLISTWVVLLIGIFDLNQKWKLKLYFFATTFCLTEQLHSLPDYLALITAVLISLQIYNQLTLPTAWDNIAYFSGFTTFFLVRIFKYIAQTYYTFSLSGRQVLCVIPAFLLASYVVIKMRVQTIKYGQIKNLKSPTLSIKYVEMLKQQLKQAESIHSYMFMHVKVCYQPNCFCHENAGLDLLNGEISEQVRMREKIINSVFLQILTTHNWNNHDRTQIIHKYTQFLIDSKQLAQAIQIHYQLQNQSMNFFNVCLNYRVSKKLKLNIKQKNYFDSYRSKLQHIINYDLQVSYVTKQIRGILFSKIILWKELCKQNPQLKFLERQGKQLVKRIQKLHEYFTFVVRPSEEILSVCKATLAYATYLVLTTNYTQFANSLVKKTKKLFEESKGDVGVRLQFGLFLKLAINHEKMMQNTFQLIIVNISADLCKLFHQGKSQIIFKNITTFIPVQFASLHSKGLNNFVRNSNLQRQNSSFFGQSIELPFYFGPRQIMYMLINPSLHIDILENCILVKCIIKKQNNEMKNFIVDLQGKIHYKEQQTFKQYVNHENTKSILSKLKNEWQTEKTITRLEQTLVENEQSLTKIFQPLFPHQLQKAGFSPLIRISIKNESLKKQAPKTQIFMISNKIKNIEGVMENKQNDSQSSNSSRKDSIQNVLMLLMQSSSLKSEVFLTITLLMLLICAIASFQIFNNFFIVWDTGVKEKNPVYTQINVINLKVLMNKAISWSYDVSKYENRKNQTEGLFNQLYRNRLKGIPFSVIGRKELQIIFKLQVFTNNNNILGQNNEVSLFLEQQMKRTIPISHPSFNNVTLQMSLSSILSNLFVEVFLLSDGKPINDTLLSFAYLPQFYGQYEKVQQNINKMLQQQMNATSRNIIIVVCFVSLLFLLFLIPIFRFNFSNKKKQEKIYSLLASLQTRLILQEIKKLQKVQSEISVIALEMNEDRGIQSGIDFPSSQQFDGNKSSDRKEQNNFQMLFQGISKMAADEMLNNVKDASRIKIRKRVGQIIVEGSNCDRKKLRKSDWLVLLFLVLFIGMTHSLVWHKMGFMNFINDHFKNSVNKINYFKSSELSILNSKIYSDSYNSTNRLKFGEVDLGDWIGNWIVQNHQQNIFQADQQIAIEQCSLDILVCINNFSQLILEQIIKQYIFQSFEETKKIVEGTKNATALTQKLRFKLFLAQQLQDYMQKRKMEQLIQTFTDIEKADRRYQLEKNAIGVIFYLLMVAFVAYSILYIVWIKKEYVQQVTLLSILNKQMLYNNKRVESFLHKLSKRA